MHIEIFVFEILFIEDYNLTFHRPFVHLMRKSEVYNYSSF